MYKIFVFTVNMEKRKVAVITGANSGIGLSLADRLLTENENIHVCLACRNTGRAEQAKTRLLRGHPGAEICILSVDTSSVESVFQAAEQIRRRFSRLDYLFLNAGIMPVSSINWDTVAAIFSSKGPIILTTGMGALNLEDGKTSDGIQKVFATNLFGHFVMVRELEDFLCKNTPTQIIWTSSRSAHRSAFSLEDLQHAQGTEPYSSSKYATDAVSIALNERLNQKMRIFVPSITASPHNGAESLIWLTRQKPESLDPRSKYCSRCSVFFQPYVGTTKLDVSDTVVDEVYKRLDNMYNKFKVKYKKPTDTLQQNGFHVSAL